MLKYLWSQLRPVSARLCLALAPFVLFRIVFYLLNRDLFARVTLSDYLKLLVIGVRFDLAGLAYFNVCWVMLALAPVFWLNTKRGRTFTVAVFLVFNGVANALAAIDLVYYRFSLTRSTRTLWSVATMGNELPRLIKPILLGYWHVLALFLAVMSALWWCYRAIEDPAPEAPSRRWYAARSALFLLTTAVLVVAMRGGFQIRPMELIAANSMAGGENVPLVTNTPWVMVVTLAKEELPQVHWFDANRQTELYTPIRNYARPPQRMRRLNVVVIVMESLSLEYLGPPFGRHSLTPRFDSLARQGLFFANAYANGGHSIVAIPAIVGSIPSVTRDPFVLSTYSANVVESLASVLGSIGYDTAFFHGGHTGTMGLDGFARSAGYKRYAGFEACSLQSEESGEWGIPDEPFFEFFEDQLTRMKEPFFATVFSLSAHHPFRLPAKWEGRFPEGRHPITKMVSYADMALGKFFDRASREAWYKDTLFVVTADHVGPGITPGASAGIGAYQIPILFFRPGQSELAGVSRTPVGQLDIMPSVLDYLGYDKDFFALGRSALRGGNGLVLDSRNEALLCVSGQTGVTFTLSELTGVYDLATDPALRTNLIHRAAWAVSAAPVYDECRAFLQTYVTALRDNKMTALRYKRK